MFNQFEDIMKEILCAVANLFIGIIACFAFLAVMCLCLAMPDILDWLSYYIGDLCTWVLYLGAFVLFITWCASKGKEN